MKVNDIKPAKFQKRLPVELTSFVGRKHEIAEIERLLASQRLVTLTGVAGCGKTRVALRLVTKVASHYGDGVYWVPLASLAESSLFVQTVAKFLGVPDEAGRSQTESLVTALKDQSILLIMDNCEHLRSACADLVAALLADTEVRVLVTSREPLQVPGEVLYPLQPMAVPPQTLPVAELAQFDAVQLFIERARAVVPPFDLTASNASAVASICAALDGIPLAIELASARINVLSIEQIAARLDHSLSLLSSAGHPSSNPHKTLRAAIDWSYALLSESEQVMLQRLAIFRGGLSLSAAEEVCRSDGIEAAQVIDLLASLVKKSLLTAQTLGVNEARYSLLEILREYGLEKLSESGNWEVIHDRHLQTFLTLTEETEPKLLGPYQQFWLNMLEREFDNIRAALVWALQTQQIAAGLRIANANYQLWTIRDYAEEGLSWYERLLAKIEDGVPPVVHAQALSYAANMSGFRGNLAKQTAYGRKAAELAEAAGEEGKQALIWALSAQAYGARAEGDFDTEYRHVRRAIELNRELGNTYLLAVGLSTASFSAMSLGKYEDARALLEEAIPLLRELGNPYRIGMALNFSGDLARCEKNYHHAHLVYEESITILRDINAVRDLASVLHNQGHVYLHLNDLETARNLFRESLVSHQTQGNKAGAAECLIGFAALAILQGEAALGMRLLVATLALRKQPASALWAATRMEYEDYLALAAGQLTEDEIETEAAIGCSLSLDQAVSTAKQIAATSPAPRKYSGGQHDLTERELEVVKLIAQAKSNSDIAAELVLSKRTVEKHIANIRSKLEITERTKIVRWAFEHGLINSEE